MRSHTKVSTATKAKQYPNSERVQSVQAFGCTTVSERTKIQGVFSLIIRWGSAHRLFI